MALGAAFIALAAAIGTAAALSADPMSVLRATLEVAGVIGVFALVCAAEGSG
jgi:uncharacterized membrane protein